ncbi:aldehyde oxidase GLOX1-like [Pyrus x bretschneideri]|uniref:aldehyde oxidase GLOX1-like n=1 Tax=Pyrus x bretschneideri TaxID=225117 RepID=UPI00202ED87F|nr:aldehyde oxidase GLOX1-like [Pyrus x bretschneideri]
MKTISLIDLSLLLLIINFSVLTAHAAGGKWQVLKNVGISAMHMQLFKNDRIVLFDRTDFGKSNLSLPNGNCVNNDCTAHSAEFVVQTNAVRPLTVLSDVWCSSGSMDAYGNLIQTGGNNIGERRVRVFTPCTGCDWKEIVDGLAARRWYATNHILPDGREIIIGGRGQFNYEFYPKTASTSNVYSLPFLSQTNDPGQENNLYPFVFLNPDGNLFVFANNRAILLDYVKNVVVKTYPQIPGGDPRSYPSTGSAVLLPLKNLMAPSVEAEVLVCGGAPKGSFVQANKGTFVEALNTCARIKITDPNPQWIVETMPQARVMGDMLLLPDSTVLLINGASSGVAGWEIGRNPVFNPVVYRPDNAVGSRFEQQNPTTIPRMYHSSALLVRDGRVIVGGSNPHEKYQFGNDVLFPTELRLEAFSPEYLDAKYANLRPTILAPGNQAKIHYGIKLAIQFSLTGTFAKNSVSVTMVAPPFSTHSFSMNQRLLVLGAENVQQVGPTTYQVQVTTPPSKNLAPSGYYILFVVHQQIPSEGIFVKIY